MKQFPFAFYVANILEIFERLAWYGFFAVSSLYMTSAKSAGGMGFSEQERGFLQGLIPFLLYLFPVVTGALGDRFGYKKMFFFSFLLLCPSYFLLGMAFDFWTFFIAFLGVAIGASIFKPLVLGTVSRTTSIENQGIGFGIFYTMVNVGGFLGPLIAGTVRGWGWNWVFRIAALWILFNFLVLLFFKDPNPGQSGKPLKEVFRDLGLVLGNARLWIFSLPILVVLMVYQWLSVGWVLGLIAAWVIVNLVWSFWVSGGAKWYCQPIRMGNKYFVLYLLFIAGFWVLYQQIFITLPLYIRDFVDTSSIVRSAFQQSPDFASWLCGIQLSEVQAYLTGQIPAPNLWTEWGIPAAQEWRFLTSGAPHSDHLSTVLALAQVKPEFLLSLNFLTILIGQIWVSHVVAKKKVFVILTFGALTIAISYVITGLAWFSGMGGVLVCVGIVLFSVGEMLTSPKSQEYIAGLMPKEYSAMYMGYYFVSMAIGFLFAGLISGWAYPFFTQQLEKPAWLWFFFGLLGLLVVILLQLFNHLWAPKLEDSVRTT